MEQSAPRDGPNGGHNRFSRFGDICICPCQEQTNLANDVKIPGFRKVRFWYALTSGLKALEPDDSSDRIAPNTVPSGIRHLLRVGPFTEPQCKLYTRHKCGLRVEPSRLLGKSLQDLTSKDFAALVKKIREVAKPTGRETAFVSKRGKCVVSDTSPPTSALIDLSTLTPSFERLLGATRYFQATAVAIFLVYLVLFATFFFILPPEIGRGVWAFLLETTVSNPTTPAGYAIKVGAMAPYVMPLFSILAAGALANFEKPVVVIIGAAAVALLGFVIWLISSMSDIFAMMPPAFFYIHWMAGPLNLLVLVLVMVGVSNLWKLDETQRNALRDGFGTGPFRTAMLRLFGLPAFVRHLGARRFVVVPLYVISSFLLASSLYPFLFAGAFANNLVRLNRSECVIQGLNRLRCFEEAMRTDAMLFPVYVGLGFLIPFGLYILTRRWARSLSITSMRDLMASDKRAPVLFLRPFEDDQVALPQADTFSLFRAIRIGDAPTHLEHQVLEEMTELGPVVAIGDRSKGNVPFGAARDYVPDTEWQGRVGHLIDSSRAIVIVLNDTPGVWWEVSTLLARDCVDRTLFVFPPTSPDRAEPLWKGFVEALEANGIERPTRWVSSRTLLGLYRDKGVWKVAYSDGVSATDTLALLRLFGTCHASQRAYPATSPRRYPFSLGLVALILLAFNIDGIFRDLVQEQAVVSQVPEGWQVETVLGPGQGPDVGDNLYFETASPGTEPGQHLGFARRAQGSPDLMWFTPGGAIEKTVTLRVPERDRALDSRLPSVSPLALRAFTPERIETAISVSDGESATLEVRKFTEVGTQLSQNIAPRIPDLVRLQSGVFAEDGALFVVGQVGLDTGARGPFAGKLGTNGRWIWYYNDFGGRGWGNAIATAPNGHSALALQIERKFFVLGLDAEGQVSFTAPAPFSEPFGAASAITPLGSDLWGVAGYVEASLDRDIDHTPIVAALDQDGVYKWQTPLPDIAGYFVKAIAHHDGKIFVAASSSGLNDARSAVVALDNKGSILETIDFVASGTRSIQTMDIASDGSVWVYGRASEIPANEAPIERVSHRSVPWVIRVSRTDASATSLSP